MSAAWVDEVLDFWFGLTSAQQFEQDPELDADIIDRFKPLWDEQQQFPAEYFLGSAREALAAVILFDQFPRNMFRGHADSFATDHLALALTKEALDRGFDAALSKDERAFLLMPFQHSEALADQQRSLLEFAKLGDANLLGFAQQHHDVIARFGRFPHRNAMLGRAPTAVEVEAGPITPF